MIRTKNAILVLGVLLATGAINVAGQNPGPAQRGGMRGPDTEMRGPGVEAIMRMGERLELTEAQIADLDVIRREAVARRSAQQTEMAELRSRLRAGQIERSEVMAYMEDRRDANAESAAELRARVEGVLTEEQLETVDELRSQANAFRRGRQSARRGPRGGDGPRARPGRRWRNDGFEPGN